LALLGIATALAGAVNSIAGGGSLISFPAALAIGLPPVVANATNCVALTPGGLASAVAYRRELGGKRRLVMLLALPAVAGGLLGAMVLLSAPERIFQLVVPWLIAGATLLLALQERIARRSAARRGPTPPRDRSGWVAVGIFFLAIYGGYFGAGMGIVILALLGLLGEATIHELNATKTVVGAAINGTAAVYFVVSGAVRYDALAVMALGAIVGGYGGAALARRARPRAVRWVVVCIGVGLSAILAVRFWR
jgi:uncharacterized membrane protein YfcA